LLRIPRIRPSTGDGAAAVQAMPCWNFGEARQVGKGLGVGAAAGARAGCGDGGHRTAGEADMASVAHGRSRGSGHAGERRGEERRGESGGRHHVLCLAADGGDAEGDADPASGRAFLAGMSRIAERRIDFRRTGGETSVSETGALEDLGVLVHDGQD
jgi:hypothetical protein